MGIATIFSGSKKDIRNHNSRVYLYAYPARVRNDGKGAYENLLKQRFFHMHMVERCEKEVTGKEKRQLGASLVEFTLLLALIAVVTVTSVKSLSTSIESKIDDESVELAASGAGNYPH